MKCPNCDGNQIKDEIYEHHCEDCSFGFGRIFDLIDPAELLRLIEKAEERTTHDEIYEAVKLYPNDPSTLKKLAGE